MSLFFIQKFEIMKKIILISTLTLSSLMSCQSQSAQSKNTNTVPTDKSITPGTSHSKNPYYSRKDTTPLQIEDAEWEKILPSEVFEVARQKATERPFTGKYWNYKGKGIYYCAACGNALFKSDAKFASSCGWPSFFQTIRSNSVAYQTDNALGMERTEVLCGRCGGHLGHIFNDGPAPTGMRYCMNSIVLEFEPETKKK